MIPRPGYEEAIETALRRGPACSLLGPRQCGKTTLARGIAARRKSAYFDLEDPRDAVRLENPLLALEGLEGLVVLDEIQRNLRLMEVLRVLVDRPGGKASFLLLGSASPDLVKSASESLAGRVGFVEMAGFDQGEVEDREALWIRGGFPRSFLASSEEDSLAWREDFIRTFLERDMPLFGVRIPPETLRRFWTMLAHYHGQTWNASTLAGSLGVSGKTVNHYLDVLCGTYMVLRLPPWRENLGKRQVKAPKVYIRDSGILHALLGIPGKEALLGHPKLGASWEGFVLEQVLRILRPFQAYYWGTHGGAELDLFLPLGGKRFGLEFKWADAPRITRSMKAALEDLHLEHLWVIYPGEQEYRLDPRITVLPASRIGELAERMGGMKPGPPG